ncbi:hypothetical protein HWV62_36488 [Athelia sp. TMB]|nr:hypothetical protein HWV62_36488 [Athelia sp. TMB]
MGVHGLTTYLRENKRLLSKSLQYQKGGAANGTIVVDAWSFCYELIHRAPNLPWVYGGEYLRFEELVTTVCEAWISVGLKVFFVFDGPRPDIKFPTIISRLTKAHVQPSLLFFRTSSASRSTPRFLHESRIIPPLIYSACVHALKSLSSSTDALELHYADGEGDPWAVELAGRVGGFVVGNDSDFVVLNSEGYLGYIPMEEMIWTTLEQIDRPSEDADSEFQPVKSKGKKKLPDPRGGNGLIPPDGASDLTLTFSVYTPGALADHLKIPASLLALFGALLGNDYSNHSTSSHRNAQSLFFPGLQNLSGRINHVASALKTILSASNLKRKPKHQVGSVMDLIDKAVEALLTRSRSTMGSGEVEAITNTIVDATLQYAIRKHTGKEQGVRSLWPTAACALHEPDLCPLISCLLASGTYEQAEAQEKAMCEQVRDSYVKAYRAGSLSPKIIDTMTSATAWPRIFLENPDSETVARSVGRLIRQWGYAILDDGVGLPDAHELSEHEQSVQEDDEDELIDVVEEDSEEESMASGVEDPLEVLRGELKRIQDTEPPQTAISLRSSRVSGSAPKTVTEYIRKGTRVAGEAVPVPPFVDMLASISSLDFDMEDLTPVQLRPENDRLTIFLHVLGSDTPLMKALPADQLMVAAALRWVVRTFGDRAADSGYSKEREKERWTKREGRAWLASFSWRLSPACSGVETAELPEASDRNIQLMAQALMALECIDEFAQILLLSNRVPSVGHLLSGSLFHSFLTGAKVPDATDIPDGLWEACEEDLGDVFAEEKKKKAKKSAKNIAAVTTAMGKGNAKALTPSSGLFGLLGELEA